MTHLDDLVPKSPAWWRQLDQDTLDDTPLGPNCSHERKALVRDRIHNYGPRCHDVRERMYRCDDCGTLITYTAKAE